MLIAKFLKDPLFWLFIILVLGAGFLINSIDINSLSAQTQVVGEGTARYLAKWVGAIPVIPTYVIAPPSASKQVGQTQQFIGWYDPDGPSGSQGNEDKTTSASWSSSNTSVATITSGLAACSTAGSVTITSVYSGITATASLTCSPVVPVAPVGPCTSLDCSAYLPYGVTRTEVVTDPVTKATSTREWVETITPTLPPVPKPRVSISGQPNPSEIEPIIDGYADRAKYTISWSSSDLGACGTCSVSGPGLSSSQTSGNATFYQTRGNYTYSATCGGGYYCSDNKGNQSQVGYDTKSVTVNVLQVPKCAFYADPGTIILPSTSFLKWSCKYANSCSINQGVGSVNNVSGSKEVRPSKTTTYALTCSGLDGSRSFQATVNVGFTPKLREVIPR